MPRSPKLLGFGVALAALGACAPPPALVYVDRNAILANEPGLIRESVFQARETPVSIDQSLSLPSLGERQFSHAAAEARVKEAREAIAANRQRALEALRRELYESLLRRLERFRAERDDALEATYARLVEEADAKLAKLFAEYADQRRPRVIRLSYHVGYPFPSVSMLSDPPADRPLDRKQVGEARQLYRELDTLEDDFRTEFVKISEEVFVKLAQARQEAALEIADQIGKNQEQAERDARAAIESISADLDLSLIDEEGVRLPAVKSETTRVRSEGARDVTPAALEGVGPIESATQRMETDLALWAKLNRYRIVKDARLGLDKTKAFQEWRTSRKVGR